MGDVVEAPFITKLDIPTERILRKAGEAGLERVLLIGEDKDGEIYFASSFGDGGHALWLMEIAKVRLMKISGEIKE